MDRKSLFISMPMDGIDDAIIKNRMEEIVKTVEFLTKSEIMLLDSFVEEETPWWKKNPGIWYLSKSLDKMAEADIVYFDRNWQSSRGCNIEWTVANKYGMPIIINDLGYKWRIKSNSSIKIDKEPIDNWIEIQYGPDPNRINGGDNMKFDIDKFKEGELAIKFTTGEQYEELITLMDMLYSLKPVTIIENIKNTIEYFNDNEGTRLLYYYGRNMLNWVGYGKRFKKETISYEDFMNLFYANEQQDGEEYTETRTIDTDNLYSLIETLEDKIEKLDNATKEAKQLLEQLKERLI